MKRNYIFIIACISTFYAQAQFIGGSRGAAMGDASVTFNDINAAYSNPAGVASLELISANAFAERRFNLDAVSIYSAAVCLPTKSGNWGLKMRQQGFSELNEQQFSLIYARKLMPNFQIGGGFSTRFVRAPSYPSTFAYTFEFGVQAQMLKTLRLGVYTYNPIQIKHRGNESLASLIKVGLQYSPSEKVNLCVEVEKDVALSATFKTGLEYLVAKNLWLRAGYKFNPSVYSFGVGYAVNKRILIDFAATQHQQLGFSPSISFVYK